MSGVAIHSSNFLVRLLRGFLEGGVREILRPHVSGETQLAMRAAELRHVADESASLAFLCVRHREILSLSDCGIGGDGNRVPPPPRFILLGEPRGSSFPGEGRLLFAVLFVALATVRVETIVAVHVGSFRRMNE